MECLCSRTDRCAELRVLPEGEFSHNTWAEYMPPTRRRAGMEAICVARRHLCLIGVQRPNFKCQRHRHEVINCAYASWMSVGERVKCLGSTTAVRTE